MDYITRVQQETWDRPRQESFSATSRTESNPQDGAKGPHFYGRKWMGNWGEKTPTDNWWWDPSCICLSRLTWTMLVCFLCQKECGPKVRLGVCLLVNVDTVPCCFGRGFLPSPFTSKFVATSTWARYNMTTCSRRKPRKTSKLPGEGGLGRWTPVTLQHDSSGTAMPSNGKCWQKLATNFTLHSVS